MGLAQELKHKISYCMTFSFKPHSQFVQGFKNLGGLPCATYQGPFTKRLSGPVSAYQLTLLYRMNMARFKISYPVRAKTRTKSLTL